jgi:hypothetical protein
MNTMNTMKLFTIVCLSVLSLATAVEPAKAAVINWGAAQNITGSSDVVTTGTLHASANFWSTGASAGSGNITVNGVQFVGFQSARSSPTSVPGPTSLTVGNITLTGTSPETNNQNLQGFADVGGPASYNNLLNQLAYVVDLSTTGTMGVSIGGLTNGAQYLIQFWVQDGRTGGVETRTSIVDGVTLDVNVSNTFGGFGQYVTGTFTADSTTQSFQVVGGVGSVAYANAMQVRIVPEPTQMVSVAAIGAALGMWRMRKLRRAKKRDAQEASA